MHEYYFSYNQIHQTIADCAQSILDSSFEPDVIVAIGSGGFIPARILRTFLNKPILTISISYYDNQNNLQTKPQEHQWLDHAYIKGKKVLLVDEVDDSRTTLEYCSTKLLNYNPTELAVFVLHNKLKPKLGQYPSCVERIFVGTNLEDHWVHYPWDAKNIKEHKNHDT